MFRTAGGVFIGLVLFLVFLVLAYQVMSAVYWREFCQASGGSAFVYEGRAYCSYLR